MAQTTTSTVSQILKEFYQGPIREQLNSEILLWKRLSKREDIVEGKTIVMPLHTGRNVGVMATVEGGTLPAAGNQQFTDMRFPIPFLYGHINLSGPVIAASRTRQGAFIQALESEIKGLVRDFKNDINRMANMDGSGRLGTVKTAGGASPVMTNPLDFNGQGNLQYFNIGDRIALVKGSAAEAALPVLIAGGLAPTVSAVDFTAKTITLSDISTYTPIAGDHLGKFANTSDTTSISATNLRLSTGGTANVNKEIMGIAGICSGTNGFPRNAGATTYSALAAGQLWANANGAINTIIGANLQTVSASSVSTWQGNCFFNGGVLRPISGDLMQRACDASEQIGQAKPTIGVASYGVRRQIVNLSVGDRRFADMNFDAGFNTISFNGIPIVPDKDAIPGTLAFLSEPDMMVARMSDFYWLDKDGSVLSRAYGSGGAMKDEWEAVMAYYADLVTSRRNAQTMIGDIRES